MLARPVASFLLGAVSTFIIPKIIRPALVGSVSAGLATKEFMQTTWTEGVYEAKKIREDAIRDREQLLEREINTLRSELADLKK